MFTVIVLALLAAAAYVVYKFLKATAGSVEIQAEQDVQAVEAAVQTDAAVAEKAVGTVVADVKAKL